MHVPRPNPPKNRQETRGAKASLRAGGRKLSMVANQKRRSLGPEDEEWQAAESEQHAILNGTAPDLAAVSAAAQEDDLPAPEYEGADETGYLADQLVEPPKVSPPPVTAVEKPADGTATALGAAERRRSMEGEDAEWAAAEKEAAARLAASS